MRESMPANAFAALQVQGEPHGLSALLFLDRLADPRIGLDRCRGVPGVRAPRQDGFWSAASAEDFSVPAGERRLSVGLVVMDGLSP